MHQEQEYLTRRVFDETSAALAAPDPHVAAVHVQLAKEYVECLNRIGAGAAEASR